MKPIYLPFTYLPESMARVLASLVGPVVVYQPVENRVCESMTDLADQGLIEIRTPLTGDEPRLHSALAEFTQWAGQNPGRLTPGAGFIGSQQGRVPFFDERTINRIRSQIRQHGTPPADTAADEAGFSARLFLCIAEDNDRTTAHLDQDLKQFKALEQGFLDSLVDSHEAGFSRHALSSEIWQEDPGAKHTEKRIRAWATLAAADRHLPELLITTSAAVVDTLMETWGEAIRLHRLAAIRIPVAAADQPPLLDQVLADLAARHTLASDDCDAFKALSAEGPNDSMVAATLYAADNVAPASVVRQLTPGGVAGPGEDISRGRVKHTLILLVESDSKSD